MPSGFEAALWGLVAGSALVLGAVLGYFLHIPQRWIAGLMALGAGVLISALAFDLMDEAYEHGGLDSTAFGFLAGVVAYTGANWWLARRGAKHRKRSGDQQPSETEQSGSGMAIFAGALLDGIPESIVIGVSLITGGIVNFPAVVAVFLSNVPEGLSSSSGMKKAGRSAGYVLGLWAVAAIISSLAAVAGYSFVHRLGSETVAFTTAVAAGAVLAMVADTMIPEAVHEAHDFTGLIAGAGFLLAFALTKA